MALGYDGKLYILAFDHRGSFQKKMFGIEGDPTPEQTATIADAKHLIFEGMADGRRARRRAGAPPACSSTSSSAATSPRRRRRAGLKLAMPVEKSGQNEFDFEYGDDFGEHILKFDPDFSKVLVRYNPDGDAEMNERQLGAPQAPRRLAARATTASSSSSCWCRPSRRPARVRRRRHRPLRRRAAPRADAPRDRGDPELRHRGRHLEDRGRRRRAPTPRCSPSRPASAGRDGVVCVLLGRGASDEKVDHWLREAAPVEGFVGFAIGRSIWWDALKGFLDGSPRARGRRPSRSPTTTCAS